MVWKCPKCKFTSKNYTVMQKHVSKSHPNKKKKNIPKGKQTKKFVFKPHKKKK